jgi:hypothetical protein
VPRGDGVVIPGKGRSTFGKDRPNIKRTGTAQYVPKKLKSRLDSFETTKLTADESRMANRPGSQNVNK